ncbi:hypothetical protein [Kribbella sp. NPDC048928]|uniref:hypothetical protein n=1 Tax=Kribbella sp. NPDC048928 TaxID=3364111 RepID=UPI0037135ED0
MRTTAQMAREGQRDLLANTDTPAPTGQEHSSVSDTSLTALAHARAAGPATDRHFQAGTTPSGPTRASGNDGARPQANGSSTTRNRDHGRGV